MKGCKIDTCKSYVGDCQEYLDRCHNTSGVYYVTPIGMHTGYDVYCDMTTDGGGWLVFQRRIDGLLDFYQGWYEYQRGFGENKHHEYWLGLLPLKRILNQGEYELRIDLEDFTGETKYAKYEAFSIGDHTENYRLKVTGYTGTANDSLSYHNGQMFSTMNRDNDQSGNYSCAQNSKGGWWYNNCHYANLNGLYLSATNKSHAIGITWFTWKGHDSSLKKTEMKIRRA